MIERSGDRKMKDSGVEWIGEIPEEWNVIKAKFLVQITNGTNPTTEGDTPVYGSGADSFKTCGEFKEGPAVLIGRKGATLHIPHYITGLYWNVDTAFDVKPQKGILLKYYYYLACCFDYEYYIIQTTLPSMTQTQYNHMKLPVPSMNTQHRIADYLDRKCAQIDSIISRQQAIIEKLKEYKLSLITEAVTKGLNPDVPMKDSGVEWIGEVPESWRVSKIKYVSSFSPACQTASLTDESIVGYAPMECIKQGFQMQYEKALSEIPKSLTPYYDGDIVMAKVTPCFENGNIAIMSDTASGIGFGSSELFVFRACNIQREYLFFWLRNLKLKSIAISTMTGTGGLKRVSPYFIKNSPIPVPPEVEQMEISVYLTEKCAAIDSTVSKKEKLIDRLTSYKKSLIYEAVTGKREI